MLKYTGLTSYQRKVTQLENEFQLKGGFQKKKIVIVHLVITISVING